MNIYYCVILVSNNLNIKPEICVFNDVHLYYTNTQQLTEDKDEAVFLCNRLSKAYPENDYCVRSIVV